MQSERSFYQQELIAAIGKYYYILIVGPIIVAITAYFLAGLLPPKYSSIAFLRIDKADSRTLESAMQMPTLLDGVLNEFPEAGDTPEKRLEFVAKNLRITDSEPQGDRGTIRPYRIQFTFSDPAGAQKIASDLIDAWLATTIPGPDRISILEGEIARYELVAKSASDLLDRIQREATTIVMPDSITGEIATPIVSLITRRDDSLAAVSRLNREMQGVSRDVIVAPPHLPAEPIRRQSTYAILAFLASIPLFLALVMFGRFFARSRSAAHA